MTTKTMTMNEVNLITWFNGQLNVIEQQSGKSVEKLTLSIDRTVSDDISIMLSLSSAVPTSP